MHSLLLPFLVTSFIHSGTGLECYISRTTNFQNRIQDKTLETENCSGRCFIRTSQLDPKVTLRGCREDFKELPAPGCYIYPADTWCFCDENLCNFGPIGWGEYGSPHVRMSRDTEFNRLGPPDGKKRRSSMKHTLRDPFIDTSEIELDTETHSPEVDRNRAVENLGIGVIKNDSNAEGKFSISNEGRLATNGPEVALRMGQLPKINKYSNNKFSLHEDAQSRQKRKPTPFGSIFTKEGRIVYRNDPWKDKWSDDSDWREPSNRHEVWQTTSSWSSYDSPYDQNQQNDYDYQNPDPTENNNYGWGGPRDQPNRQQKSSHYQRQENSNPYSKDNFESQNRIQGFQEPSEHSTIFTKGGKISRQDVFPMHEDSNLHRQFVVEKSKNTRDENLQSWETDSPVEIDDSFWDFSALLESEESRSGHEATNLPRYRTTQLPWKYRTTTPTMKQWHYQTPTARTTKNVQNNQAKNIKTPTKKFTKGFLYKTPGEKELIIKEKQATRKIPRSSTIATTKQPTERPKTTETTTTLKPTTIKRTTTTSTTTTERTTTRPSTTTITTTTTTTTTTPKTPLTRAKITVPPTLKYRKLAKAERHKSALSKGVKSGKSPVDENDLQPCRTIPGQKPSKGCLTEPMRILTHDVQTSRVGLTATTVKSVLQTALHLNMSTASANSNDTEGLRMGKSDGLTAMSNSPETKYSTSSLLTVLFLPGLLNLFKMTL